jgi:hypothetical protein
MITPTLSHTATIPNSDFLAFGISDHYANRHRGELEALANDFGAAFAGDCFVAHREVVESHPDYVSTVLFLASFVGVLPPS